MFALVVHAAEKLPPSSLLKEAASKADAVIFAGIESANMPRGGFAATKVRIRKVYRGSLRIGDSLTYHSLKEKNEYSRLWLDRGVIVFLTSKQPSGAMEWGAAGDFFEFPFSNTLEKKIIGLLRKK